MSTSLLSVAELLKQHRQMNKTHVTTGLSSVASLRLTRREMTEGQYTGSLRPIDASCRDDVIAVDSLVSTHDKGKDGGEWQPTELVKPGDTQCHVT